MTKQRVPYFSRLRFATGIIATWLMNLNVFGFSLRSVCAPGFNCHGCPWATAACPIGALTYGSAIHAIPLLAIASILAVGVVLGRLVCGFFCPFGLLQDLLHRIPTPKLRLPRWARFGKYLTLLLLVLVLPWLFGFEQSGYLMVAPAIDRAPNDKLDVGITLTNAGMETIKGVHLDVRWRKTGVTEETFTYQDKKDYPELVLEAGQSIALPHFLIPNQFATSELLVDSPQSVIQQTPRYQLYFCKLCPSGTLTASFPHLVQRAGQPGWEAWVNGLTLRLGILAVILVLMVIASRPFCRMFCPLGAIYALTPRVALTRIQIDASACTHCGLCNEACPVELNVTKEIGGMECIACGDCKKACPNGGIRRVVGLGIKE